MCVGIRLPEADAWHEWAMESSAVGWDATIDDGLG